MNETDTSVFAEICSYADMRYNDGQAHCQGQTRSSSQCFHPKFQSSLKWESQDHAVLAVTRQGTAQLTVF